MTLADIIRELYQVSMQLECETDPEQIRLLKLDEAELTQIIDQMKRREK